MKHPDYRTVPFSCLEEFGQQITKLPKSDRNAELEALERDKKLTKPVGSLGKLEELAIWYYSWRVHADPLRLNPQIIIFAGNHGVAQHGVSAFPVDVTHQMVNNFDSGGAAINQLAKLSNAQMHTIPMHDLRPTSDITVEAAMSEDECVDAISEGWLQVNPESQLLIVGEMGIGNTTSASAICLALYGGSSEDWVGSGTGVKNLTHKQKIVAKAVKTNGPFLPNQGLEILRRLGGRELAAMTGAIISARFMKIPVLLDGFVCCAAAACLHSLADDALDHTFSGHLSAEGAHSTLLKRIRKKPLLDLGMRLGEGSGAAVAINILKSALACHSGMATFKSAGISKD